VNTERTTVGGEHRAGARPGAGPVLPPSTGAAGGEHGVVDGHRRAVRCGGGTRAGGTGTRHTAQITSVRHYGQRLNQTHPRSVIAARRADRAGEQQPVAGLRDTADLLLPFGRGPLAPVRRRVLAWARRWSGVRDAALHSFTRGWPFMRSGYLELGRRLAAEGLLATADDVFYLTGDELHRWVHDGVGDAGWFEAVRVRRARRRWQQRLTPPDVVPADARVVMFGVDITVLALFGVTSSSPDGGLSGSAVSPGTYTGRARVMHEISQAGELQRGEVLVVRHLTPAWAPLLARVGAVVADVGGALSHGSVVAREYGVPAVMGTKDATARISSGDVITVDESAGIVWAPCEK